jgi:hypothetical protein
MGHRSCSGGSVGSVLVEYWKAQNGRHPAPAKLARERAHHDCEPGAAAAPLHRRRRCHRRCRAEDCLSEVADRGAPRTLDVPRVRLGSAATRADAHRFTSYEVRSNSVSELCHMPPETPVKHRDLRGDSDAHHCCGKSLIGSALVRVGVRQHARAESISKRAPSTTRTSLRI